MTMPVSVMNSYWISCVLTRCPICDERYDLLTTQHSDFNKEVIKTNGGITVDVVCYPCGTEYKVRIPKRTTLEDEIR